MDQGPQLLLSLIFC